VCHSQIITNLQKFVKDKMDGEGGRLSFAEYFMDDQIGAVQLQIGQSRDDKYKKV